MPTYPSMLAAGVTSEGSFDPAELYAGDGDIITDNAVAGTTITQFQIVARGEDGLLYPYNELTGTASKAGTFSGVGTAADTITINGQAITLVASASAPHEVTIGGTPTLTAVAVAAEINAFPDIYNVRATQSGAVVTLYALFPGAGGNSIAISEAGSGFSFAGGATALSGGADETEARAIGIAAQGGTVGEGIPIFVAGVFNHAMLVWPAELTTLAQRKAVFDRTNIVIAALKGVSSYMTIPA